MVNFKGGSGKTSTAIHAAQDLAMRGYRVQGYLDFANCPKRKNDVAKNNCSNIPLLGLC
ncbi:nucleotide-binding protein [Paracoccus mutanolyticus]